MRSPLAEMARRQGKGAGRFFVYDSLLSEYARRDQPLGDESAEGVLVARRQEQ